MCVCEKWVKGIEYTSPDEPWVMCRIGESLHCILETTRTLYVVYTGTTTFKKEENKRVEHRNFASIFAIYMYIYIFKSKSICSSTQNASSLPRPGGDNVLPISAAHRTRGNTGL